MKIWNDNNKESWVKSESEEVTMGKEKEKFCQLYKELAELIGDKETVKLWENYQGLTISFPKKLYSNDYVRSYINENIGKKTIKEIAKEVELSERRVRQIMNENKRN